MHLPSLHVAAAVAEPVDDADAGDVDVAVVDEPPGLVEVALAVCVEPAPGPALLEPELVPVAFALALPDADPLACIPALVPDDDVFSGLSVSLLAPSFTVQLARASTMPVAINPATLMECLALIPTWFLVRRIAVPSDSGLRR